MIVNGIPDYDNTGSFSNVFGKYFYPRLGARKDTFKTLFDATIALPYPPTIVETGCLRALENWEGDGQSSFMFYEFVNNRGGQFWSVDLDPENVTLAKGLLLGADISEGDSVKFLNNFDAQIDVLYLDSFDFNSKNPLPAALHCLMELCAANRNLRSGSLVVIDDTLRPDNQPYGKGMFVDQFMRKVGAELLASGYQDVWRMK